MNEYPDYWHENQADEARAVMKEEQELKETLEHALGDTTHYRNYFATAEDCDTWTICLELERRGHMIRGRSIEGGTTYFHVTEEGKKIAYK